MAGKRSNGEKGRRVLRDDAALRSFFADLGDFVPEEGAHTGTKPDLWHTAAYMVEQAKLDDLFKSWRAEDDFTRSRPGAGLGFGITRSLVEQMGDGIQIQSEVGKGSTFSFRFTVAV